MKPPKELQYDCRIGGGWGCRVEWWPDSSQFEKKPFSYDTVYDVVGWLTPRPKVGETLLDEFERSWMLFEFVEVKTMRDPRDMFYGKVKIRKQLRKEGA